MKKIVSILLVMAVILACAGCSEKKTNLTVGETLKAEFLEIAKNETEPLAIAEKLAGNEVIEFMPMTVEIEEGYLAGFDADEIRGFESGAIFGPMIGSIPFIGYIFSLGEDANVDEFVSMLEANANLRWNVCVSADEMHTAKSGNLVFFLMSPLSMEQENPEVAE